MRVFVTGASGHIGGAVTTELLAAGHEVLGLARSDEAALVVADAGAQVHRGELDDLEGLRLAASSVDAVIHLAFKHDEMRAGQFESSAAADFAAIRAMGDALRGSGKPFTIASGTLALAFLGLDRPGTELDVVPGGSRIDAENYVIALASEGVRSSAVRLPPTVHSSLDLHGFVPDLITMAREQQGSYYVGEGENRWPAVHTLDAAHLFRLAIESAPPGTRLHAVADEGVAFRDIASAIGRGARVPSLSVASDEAASRLGYLSFFAALDSPASSSLTREIVGWQPRHPDLLSDLDEGHYFLR